VIVVDASVLANVIGDDHLDGDAARRRLASEADIATPDLADVEAVAVLRKRWLLGDLDDGRFGDAVAVLAALPLQRVVVLHANHANEIDAAVADACRALADAGATLLNQSVLLRGVNDDVDVLAALSERLFACGVLPYYLHQLDRVAGAAHFEVDELLAAALVSDLRRRLPGYLVPRWVREVAGAPYKLPLPHAGSMEIAGRIR
jgi:predicted nucleic acid-binding protein